MNQLTADQIIVGHCYRAKRPRQAGFGHVNDRDVIYRDQDSVQYDGPAVKFGRRKPVVSIEDFLAWAGADVTDQVPADSYAEWPIRKRGQQPEVCTEVRKRPEPKLVNLGQYLFDTIVGK